MAAHGRNSLIILVAALAPLVFQVTGTGRNQGDWAVKGTVPVPIPIEEKIPVPIPVNGTIPVPIPIGDVSRIIGGAPTSAEEFPWQAYVGGCGASIISRTWILSAAHCFADGDPDILSDKFVLRSRRITIYVGLTKRSEIYSDPDVQVRTINEDELDNHLFVHKDYKKGAILNNDIALIKLKEPLTFNAKVQPIDLAVTTDFIPGKELTTSGWGKTSDESGSDPDILHYVNGLKLISKEECKETYGIYINENHICHKTKNKNVCNGDSGGPVITGTGNSNGPPYVQIGINSFVSGSGCEAYDPGAFTDVALFRSWIDQIISGSNSDTCEDSSSKCAKLAAKGKCGKGKNFWKCKSSCACGTKSDIPCEDTKSKCPKLAAEGKCKKASIYKKCKLSCACVQEMTTVQAISSTRE